MYQIHICSTVDPIKPINEPSQKRPLAEQLVVSIDGCVVAGQGERASETIKIDYIKYYLVPGAVRATWLLFVDFSFQLNQFNRHLTLFHLELLIPFVACKEGFDFGRFILFCQQKTIFYRCLWSYCSVTTVFHCGPGIATTNTMPSLGSRSLG